MKIGKHQSVAGVLLLALNAMQPAQADFDQWRISEIFSNEDGTVQYIEMQTTASNQINLSGLSLTALNANGQQRGSILFSANLTGQTANKRVLIATPGFVTSTGLSADLQIPAGFLSTEGGTIRFATTVSSVAYTASQLPRNGVQAIDGSATAVAPTPTNFAGLSATVSLPVAALFDASNSILTLPVLDIPGVGLANVAFDVNLTSVRFALRNNFYLYGAGIVAGNTPARLLPGNILNVPRLVVGNEIYDFNLALLPGDPVSFGNLAVRSVTNTVPPPAPLPTALQQSIARGKIEYDLQCSSCHGGTGGGGGSGFAFAPNLRISGVNTFASLRALIDATMPPGNPNSCRDSGTSTCATDTANYILNVFQQSQSASPEDAVVTSPY